jgi:hypothetical protein
MPEHIADYLSEREPTFLDCCSTCLRASGEANQPWTHLGVVFHADAPTRPQPFAHTPIAWCTPFGYTHRQRRVGSSICRFVGVSKATGGESDRSDHGKSRASMFLAANGRFSREVQPGQEVNIA